jgi:hypothetical protein
MVLRVMRSIVLAFVKRWKGLIHLVAFDPEKVFLAAHTVNICNIVKQNTNPSAGSLDREVLWTVERSHSVELVIGNGHCCVVVVYCDMPRREVGGTHAISVMIAQRTPLWILWIKDQARKLML